VRAFGQAADSGECARRVTYVLLQLHALHKKTPPLILHRACLRLRKYFNWIHSTQGIEFLHRPQLSVDEEKLHFRPKARILIVKFIAHFIEKSRQCWTR
jgi:hypothetical protein